MTERYQVVVAAGVLRSPDSGATTFPHRWTDRGVTVETAFTGAHLLHLSVAACVLNDTYREAAARGVSLRGVRVTAGGGFDEDWRSRGVDYVVELDTEAPVGAQDALLDAVDAVAEVPKALRAGSPVRRVDALR
jgi:uncharacterized OsmC-like protein